MNIVPAVPRSTEHGGLAACELCLATFAMTNKLTAPFSASVMIGPTIPPNLLSPRNDDSDSEDDVGPAPPPQQKETKPQQRAIGPTLPSYPPTYNPTTFQDDDSDDDDFGPKPLPVGMQHETPDAVKEFIEREERMRKLAEVCLSLRI